jgi:hypothetical protein
MVDINMQEVARIAELGEAAASAALHAAAPSSFSAAFDIRLERIGSATLLIAARSYV